jgi:(p)ppGpp synthase/HD superfamily hydrolase
LCARRSPGFFHVALSQRFTDALVYAAGLHATQVRKGSGVPYVAHLLAVAAIALEHGADEDEAIAALLHDAIEDQGGDATRQELRRRFGDRVTAIVDGCTDTDLDPKPPWRQRKEAYLAHLPGASDSVRLVSASDKLHNARSLLADYRQLGEAVWARFNGSRDGTLWYYRALVTTYRQAGGSPLVDELDRVVSQIEALAAAGR